MRTGILNFGKNAILWLSIFFIGFLCLVSLVSTTYFNAETSRAEHPRYRMDGLHWNLLFLILFFLFLYFLNRKKLLERISVKILAFIAVCFVVGVSLLWVAVSHTYPEADQKAVSWMAWLMSQNNFLYFEHGKYMQIYPNQLGLAAILDLLYRLLGSIYVSDSLIQRSRGISALQNYGSAFFKKENQQSGTAAFYGMYSNYAVYYISLWNYIGTCPCSCFFFVFITISGFGEEKKKADLLCNSFGSFYRSGYFSKE